MTGTQQLRRSRGGEAAAKTIILVGAGPTAIKFVGENALVNEFDSSK